MYIVMKIGIPKELPQRLRVRDGKGDWVKDGAKWPPATLAVKAQLTPILLNPFVPGIIPDASYSCKQKWRNLLLYYLLRNGLALI